MLPEPKPTALLIAEIISGNLTRLTFHTRKAFLFAQIKAPRHGYFYETDHSKSVCNLQISAGFDVYEVIAYFNSYTEE